MVSYLIASVASVIFLAGGIYAIRAAIRMKVGFVLLAMLTITDLFAVAAPFLIVRDAHQPVLAVLKKSEWKCTASHKVTSMTMAGKVPIMTTLTRCDIYSREVSK